MSKNSPADLWDACASMEIASYNILSSALKPFGSSIKTCYEAGFQAPTLPSNKHQSEDIALAALFLKRSLTDLRSVWVLINLGYTSQAATVAAALYEHALTVNALAGHPKRIILIKQNKMGDVPWSPLKLAKLLAQQEKEVKFTKGIEFNESDFRKSWETVYVAYKFLCKVKHPTLRSVVYGSLNTSLHEEYVVMSAPDLREEDLSLKATIILTSISRCYQAIRRFAVTLNPDESLSYCQDFLERMSSIEINATEAYKQLSTASLPFIIRRDEF